MPAVRKAPKLATGAQVEKWVAGVPRTMTSGKTETDPERLIAVGKLYYDRFYGEGNWMGDLDFPFTVRGDVAANENTPTAYLYYLYTFVNPRARRPTTRGPSPHQPDPFVGEGMRDAALKQMVERGFKLTDYEEQTLPEAVKLLLNKKLTELQAAYLERLRAEELKKAVKLPPTPLGRTVSKILGFDAPTVEEEKEALEQTQRP